MNIKSASEDDYAAVSELFQRKWAREKGECPKLEYIFVIANTQILEKWHSYRRILETDTVENHFHGTKLTCNLSSTRTLCTDSNCGVCGLSRSGFDPLRIRTNIEFQ